MEPRPKKGARLPFLYRRGEKAARKKEHGMKNRNSSHKTKSYGKTAAALVLLILVAAAAVFAVLARFKDEPAPDGQTVRLDGKTDSAGDDGNTGGAAFQDASIDLGQGLTVIGMGSYTGPFYEDAGDEQVSEILAVTVKNNSDKYLEYIEFELTIGGKSCEFSLSTLPSGQSAVVLEKNRCAYTDATAEGASVSACAFFETQPDMHEDIAALTFADGIINAENISDSDIAGDVRVYYKNKVGGVYYGGITYRVRIEGGIPAGEIRQVPASHFSTNSSEVMFVTIGQ